MGIETSSNYSAKRTFNFPKLMISREDQAIVLFTKSCSGTVVEEGCEGDSVSIGEHSNNWDMSTFSNYHGDIIITNR